MDKNFAYCSHISAVCSSCFYHMRDLQRIRRHLDLDSAKLLATALVLHRVDYCNSLLYGIAGIDLTRFKCVQNQSAHLVTKSPPFIHSVPLLRSLHWLPVRFRILFKINLLTYNTVHEKNSLFISTPCLPHCSHPVHWDRTKVIVCQSLGSRPTHVQELFTLVLCLFWNNPPLSVCLAILVVTFKKHLKTHLFDLAFPS